MVEQQLADLRDAVRAVAEPTALEQRLPFDNLVERALRRRQRRRRAVSAAVIGALGAGLALAWPVADRLSAPPANHPRPPAGDRYLLEGFDFASVERGYALVLRCPAAPLQCSSHATLLATGDGGRTWSRVPSPADTGLAEATHIDTVTTTGGIVLSLGFARFASPDGGRHWKPLPDSAIRGPVIGTLPDGWVMTVEEGGRLAAYDPLTNQMRRLAHQPPGMDTRGSWPVGPGPGGRLVLSGPVAGRPTVAYSNDHARTWQLAPLPASVRPAAMTVPLADPASQRIYLVLGDESARLTAIWRLDHPGAAWVEVPLPDEVSTEPEAGMMKVVRMLPNGELLYGLDLPLRTENGGTVTVPFGALQVYGTQVTLRDLGPSIGGTLYATVPPQVDLPPGVLTILVSTDAGRTWIPRESHP